MQPGSVAPVENKSAVISHDPEPEKRTRSRSSAARGCDGGGRLPYGISLARRAEPILQLSGDGQPLQSTRAKTRPSAPRSRSPRHRLNHSASKTAQPDADALPRTAPRRSAAGTRAPTARESRSVGFSHRPARWPECHGSLMYRYLRKQPGRSGAGSSRYKTTSRRGYGSWIRGKRRTSR